MQRRRKGLVGPLSPQADTHSPVVKGLLRGDGLNRSRGNWWQHLEQRGADICLEIEGRRTMASIGTTVPTVNVSATALRFFFKITLKRRDLADAVVSVREPRRLPVVLRSVSGRAVAVLR